MGKGMYKFFWTSPMPTNLDDAKLEIARLRQRLHRQNLKMEAMAANTFQILTDDGKIVKVITVGTNIEERSPKAEGLTDAEPVRKNGQHSFFSPSQNGLALVLPLLLPCPTEERD